MIMVCEPVNMSVGLEYVIVLKKHLAFFILLQ